MIVDQALRERLELAMECRLTEHAAFLGIEKGGRIDGIVALDLWNGDDVEVWLCGKGCITRRFLRELAGYVFGTLGCERVTAYANKASTKWVDVLKRIGFRVEGVKRCAYKGNDLVMLGMLRSECKWVDQDARAASPTLTPLT